MAKNYLFILFFTIFCCSSNAQIDAADSTQTDSVITKKTFTASIELFAVQALPWSYNYFVRNAAFARINFKSIGENLKLTSWEWDDNNFKTNQFAHPYHGNLYFNSFRSNDHSFWQAVPAAFTGSFMWETIGETHHPAINDFINTSLGGISIGEITHRLSNQIIDNNRRGFERQLMEVCGLLINPMNGFNRIVDKKWGRYGKNSIDRIPNNLQLEVNVGSRRYNRITDDKFYKGKNEIFGSVRLQYGSRHKDFNKPFSSFSSLIEVGSSDTAKLNLVRIEGTLAGWNVNYRDTIPKHVVLLTMNYDYYHNTAFLYGGQSFNAKWLSNFKAGKKADFCTEVGVGAVALGAVPDAYLYYGEGRNYDYGPGLNLSIEAGYSRPKLWYNISYHGSWFHTLNGSRSNYYLHTITQDAKFNLYKKLSMEFEWGVFALHGYYKDHPNLKKTYPYVRVSYAYKFSL